MSFGSAVALVQAFALKEGDSPAFPNLGVTRKQFAHELINRIDSQSLMDQNSTSLCGPAVFLFAILRKEPETFARYATELYDTGKAKIGNLTVEPGAACRNYVPEPGSVAPVDWVTLASLRDSSNLIPYSSPAVKLGGLTLPRSLAGWFTAAGFEHVDNQTNLMVDAGLKTLLEADRERSSGAAVCLYIGSYVLKGMAGGTAVANHWVALTTPVQIGGEPASLQLGKSPRELSYTTVQELSLEFSVFTWGETNRPVTKRHPALNVRTFLDYFYGYVSAR